MAPSSASRAKRIPRETMLSMLTNITSVATAVGVLAAVVQLLLSRRQARATFEHEFIKRYWSIGDDSLQDPSAHSGMIRRHRYLRLCEDEFEVMRLGSVSWRTWEVWHEAIRGEAAQYSDDVEAFDWLATCLGLDDHRGSDCQGIFRSGTSSHSRHLSARWPSSLGRAWFLALSSLRRVVYHHGARFSQYDPAR